MTPRGGLVVCEDDAVDRVVDTTRGARHRERQPPDRDHAQGEAFVFGVNTYSDSELAGVCFSPDGDTMFVNLYGAVDGHARPSTRTGHDVRNHRPLEARAALI